MTRDSNKCFWKKICDAKASELQRRFVGEAAVASGQLKPGTDTELLIDALNGPLFFRWLQGHAPLDKGFAERIFDKVIPAFQEKYSGCQLFAGTCLKRVACGCVQQGMKTYYVTDLFGKMASKASLDHGIENASGFAQLQKALPIR